MNAMVNKEEDVQFKSVTMTVSHIFRGETVAR